jgi:hypothetical protein
VRPHGANSGRFSGIAGIAAAALKFDRIHGNSYRAPFTPGRIKDVDIPRQRHQYDQVLVSLPVMR